VKNHHICTYLEVKGDETETSMFNGLMGILLGPKTETSTLLFFLNEDRAQATLFDIRNLDEEAARV
jgi:hypothetical protein